MAASIDPFIAGLLHTLAVAGAMLLWLWAGALALIYATVGTVLIASAVVGLRERWSWRSRKK